MSHRLPTTHAHWNALPLPLVSIDLATFCANSELFNYLLISLFWFTQVCLQLVLILWHPKDKKDVKQAIRWPLMTIIYGVLRAGNKAGVMTPVSKGSPVKCATCLRLNKANICREGSTKNRRLSAKISAGVDLSNPQLVDPPVLVLRQC